jgi:hypothetical protein
VGTNKNTSVGHLAFNSSMLCTGALYWCAVLSSLDCSYNTGLEHDKAIERKD